MVLQQYGYVAIISSLTIHNWKYIDIPCLQQDLMRHLGGGAGFTKINLADANNQMTSWSVDLQLKNICVISSTY